MTRLGIRFLSSPSIPPPIIMQRWQPQCIPQHMCALIYQYKDIIIEENKYLYATITNYLTIAKNKSLLKQRHRDTKNHGEMIDCITRHVCQEIQGVDEMVLMMLMKVLMLVLMMPLPEGSRVHRRRFRQRFPPPISASGGLLTPFLCVFDLHRRLFTIRVGGTLYSPF